MDQLILQYILPFIKKFRKNLLVCALIALYLVAFWLLFFTKGIYVNDHFYKKSANLTQITYTSRNPLADFDSIIVQKYVDKTAISVDDAYIIDVSANGSWSCTEYAGDTSVIDKIDWYAIATQQTEQNRGFGQKCWIFALVCLVVTLYCRFNSTKLYEIFNKNKAAGEGYYKLINISTAVVVAAVLVYLILPL